MTAALTPESIANLDPMEFKSITVGGRTFVVPEATTYRQDIAAMDVTDQADLESLFATVEKGKTTFETFNRKLLLHLYRKDLLFKAMAALLVEEGVPWTKERARANEVFFEENDSEDEKVAMAPAVAKVLLHFFVQGLESGKISLNYFRDGDDEPSQPSPSPSAGPTPSASGDPASASSPTTTPRRSKRSSTGRSAKGA